MIGSVRNNAGMSRLGHCLLFMYLLAFSAPLQAEDLLDPNVTQYKLDNGLTIVLAPSKTAQTVALVTLYGVGSANEAPGRSGFAHLFEHLMFEGTKAIPDFEAALSASGGESNAFTQQDATTYYMTGPQEALPLFLRLDADRMANLANAVSKEDLDNQRKVVLNEMRQNLLDQPGGAAAVQLDAALYPAGHPYAHATIGSIADLEAATVEDVTAFHRAYYVPSNAYVAITGKFDPATARELINKTFALVPKSEYSGRRQATKVEPRPQRLKFADAVAAPQIMFRWPGAAGSSRETVINKMAARALSVGKGSFDDRLIIQQGIAAQAGAYWQDRALGGVFLLSASAAPNAGTDKLEAAMRSAFDTIKTKGVSDETLKVVRADFESGYESVPSNPVGFALTLAESAQTGDARAWKRELGWLKSATAAEVTAALQSFNADSALIAIVEPGPRNTSFPPVIANSTGDTAAPATAARPEIVMPEFAALKSADVVFPATETLKLASGATLQTYRVEDSAKVGISILVKGGDNDAPVGLSDLGMSVTYRGAGDLALPEMDSRYRAKGISLYGFSGRRFSQINASAPRAKLNDLADQLADVVMRPRFDQAEWSALISQKVTDIEAQRKQPDYMASRKLADLLYPAGALETRLPDPAALRTFKSADAQALYVARMRPDATTFHVASNLPAGEIVAALDRAFAGWSVAGRVGPFDTGSLPSVKETRADTDMPGATQTVILAAMPAPDESTGERAAFEIAVQVLGAGTSSRLNANLREEKGWSYGASASVDGEMRRNDSLLFISATVQSDHTEDSIREIRKIIAELKSSPITETEFKAAQQTIMARYLGYFADAAGTASTAGYISAAGYTIADLQNGLKAIKKTTLDEVNRQATVIAQSPIAISIAGDESKMK
jgi:zinc protease